MIRAFVLLLFIGIANPAFSQGKWVKLAPFPEPAEELVGASANGKLYVFCGLAPGWKPMGLVYEYDPPTEKWTKKKPMALPSHHVSFTEYKGKNLRLRRLHAAPGRAGMGADRQCLGIRSG